MPGVGKTVFALAIADALQEDYPDGCLFFDMLGVTKDSGPRTYIDAMRHVVQSIQPARPLPTGDQQLTDHYFSVLKEKRLLVVLDNVASKEQVERLLPPPSVLLLITSRSVLNIPG